MRKKVRVLWGLAICKFARFIDRPKLWAKGMDIILSSNRF